MAIPDRRRRPLSELSARYNGFTLGVFLASMRDPYVAGRYPEFRRRVVDFLEEAGIRAPIARTQRAFVRQADATLAAVLAQAKGVSGVLRDFVGLGTMAVMYASNIRIMAADQASILRDRWVPVLQRHQVPESAYDEWLAALPRHAGVLTADDVLTPAALLLAYALEEVKPDNDTCFVAMPFRSPYLEHFNRFYRRALDDINMQAVRAWGGLSSEEYYLSLQMLISRSGAMLAELATGNPNVYNEIGIAHGTLRPVFLVCRAPAEEVPSNIGHLPVCVYDDRRPRWQTKERARLAEYMVWVLQEFERRYAPAYRQFLSENLEPRQAATERTRRRPHSRSDQRLASDIRR